MSTGDRTISRRGLSALGVAGLAAAGGAALAPSAAAAPRAALAGIETIECVDDLLAGAADGAQLQLLGYWKDAPGIAGAGIGGGVLYWDAASTEAGNGGTVFAVDGVATGRWKRPASTTINLADFGCLGVGDTDDSDRVQKAVDALPLGGIIEFGPGKIRIQSTIRVERVPITFRGVGPTDSLGTGTQFLIATGTADGFVLSGCHGGGFRDLQFQGVNLQGGYMIRTERIGPEKDDGNYMLTFQNVRFRLGYNGILLRSCNTVRFLNCVWNEFHGEQVILLNGEANTSRADPVEFVECAIAAGTDNPNTDNVVIDGQGGSIKFIGVAILFGRHGIWMRNTITTDPDDDALPKFLYFEGGGFENGHGHPVLLEKGAQAKFANCYISCDGVHDNVRILETFTGGALFTGCVIRGSGRHGIDVASTRVTVTGCTIGNNGRFAHTDYGLAVTGVAAVSGGVRVTLGTAHGWETGDRVRIEQVAGAVGVNGTWPITVVDATRVDLAGAALGGTYSGGGLAMLTGTGIHLRSTASKVVVTGNILGRLAEGSHRQDYGLISAAPDVLISNNDLAGNAVGPYLLTGTQNAQTRIIGNKGMEQLDGRLIARVAGAVADGLYDFGNLLYLDGQRIRITRVTRVVGAGSCTVQLEAAGALVGSQQATTTSLQTIQLTVPPAVDALAAPKRLQVRVAGASGAQNLEVQFGYQLVS
ncbi:right-handed parallel beta-helix repeat-containing protein [Jiangella alkaliphila]|uniref:Right handed beta helix region n=1 Tax=Jiangella alkaliphila TaxID=419479 RepID=A0A1H2G1H6_9ACTN|nr:right-handed parallel beta-helix repeat-containing protein [Jiangella alkaliphila]SDU13350.1 Right handed beta helix region [Jiangella alkaliphila]